jgi:hypothetical protein
VYVDETMSLSRRRKASIRVLIAVCWFGAMAWLVRYEAFPGWFAHSLAGYRGMLTGGAVILDSWMKISFRDVPMGYSHTRVDSNERDPAGVYVVENRTVLQLNLMGQPHTLTVASEAALDALYHLQRFKFTMSSQLYTARIDGRRTGRTRFWVRMWTGGQTQQFLVEIPDDVIVYSPLIEMSLGRMKPGQDLRVRTFDPVMLTPADVVIRALNWEMLPTAEGEVEALMLTMEMHRTQVRAWVDRDGRMLRQETPFGWVMEACEPEDALGFLDVPDVAAPDLLRALSVPVEGKISDPRACRRMVVRLAGTALADEPFPVDRQQVVHADDQYVELDISAATVPAEALPVGVAPPRMRRWLESTAFVQAEHPDIVRRAKAIIGDAADGVEAARAIYEWVHRNVKKKAAVSLPSAVDVLKQLEGDCNEHTYLFVALARAVGIPAQIRVGLVYLDGAFYYHAWPAVFVGEWWEMDPTLGQESVDATHIALLEGELAAQLQLAGMIGRARATIVAEEY